MQYSVHTQHCSLTPELGAWIDRHLAGSLGRIWDRGTSELEVHLRDLRLGKSGSDMECRLVFRHQFGPPMVITELADDLRTALYLARRRLLRRARRELERRLRAGRWPKKFYAAKIVNEGRIIDNPVRIPASAEVAGRETLH